MTRNFRTILLCVVGIISIALSIKCYSFKELDYESESAYGCDAYTGIQNAAATTSKNVKELASIVQFGFGSLLMVNGLTLLAFGLTTPIQKKQTEEKDNVETTSSQEVTEKAIDSNINTENTTV